MPGPAEGPSLAKEQEPKGQKAKQIRSSRYSVIGEVAHQDSSHANDSFLCFNLGSARQVVISSKKPDRFLKLVRFIPRLLQHHPISAYINVYCSQPL